MKELDKTYNPSEIEGRIYDKWMEKKYFHAEVNQRQKAIYNCNAAAEYYRTASYGSCTG